MILLLRTISDQNDQPTNCRPKPHTHRDNAITDRRTDKHPKRTKRDVTSAEKQDIDRKSTTKTQHSATTAKSQRPANGSLAETVRTARQLRPPPIAASPWSQYSDSDQRNNHFQPANFNRFPDTPQLPQQHYNGNNGNTANRYYKDNSNSNDFHPLVNLYSHGNSVSDLPKHPTYTLTNGASNNFRPYEERERERERERDRELDRDQQRPKEFDYFPPNYKTTTKSTPPSAAQFAPVSYHQSGTSQSLKNHHNTEQLPDNFSYFHQADKSAKNAGERDHRKINPPEYSNKVPNVAILPNATPKNHFISFSNVGGFFNNHPATTPASNFDNYKNKYRSNYSQATGNAAAQPSFEHVDSNRYNSYFPTTPKPPANYYTANGAQPSPQLDAAGFDSDFYSAYMNQVQKGKAAPQRTTTTTPTAANTSSRPSYYISQLTENTFLSPSERPAQTVFHRPASVSSTPGPVVGVDFDFNKFIERIRQDQLSNLKAGLETTTRQRFNANEDDGPAPAPVTLSTKLNALPSGTVQRHRNEPMFYATKPTVQPNKFFTTKTSTTLGSEEYYYDDDEDEATTARAPSRPPTTTTSATTTTRAPKGYEQFIKSIPKPVTKLQPIVGPAASAEHPADADEDDDDDDDEYYYDDDEYDFHVPPPNKYMPMSETRSPRPTTPYPGQRVPPSRPPTHTDPINFGVTQRPVFGIRTDVTTSTTTTPVPPAIIQFPKDIFQDIQPIGTLPRYLNNATLRPYTIRTRLLNANPGVVDSTPVRQSTVTGGGQQTSTMETTTTASASAASTTATATTTTPTSGQRTNGLRPRSSTTVRPMTTTTRKVYTIRPYRGQPKWKNAKSVKGSDKKNQLDVDDKTQPSRYCVRLFVVRNDERRTRLTTAATPPLNSFFCLIHLQCTPICTHTQNTMPPTPHPNTNRIESSTQTPHVYVQQASRPAQQPTTATTSSHRNYYNTSTTQQQQQQPPQQQQYDNYYSVYDDDADVYRDDYQQQYTNIKATQPAVQSTYRPSTIATQTASPATSGATRAGPNVRDHDAYNVRQQPQQEIVYQQRQPVQQSPAYNPEYDEGLIAQVSAAATLLAN